MESANKLGDFHICGVLTNEAISEYKEEPVASLKERMAILFSLRCVDMVMIQYSKDPTENLKKISEQFKNTKLILIHGSDWKKVPGSDYIKKVKGEVVQPPFYEKLSANSIIEKLLSTKK